MTSLLAPNANLPAAPAIVARGVWRLTLPVLVLCPTVQPVHAYLIEDDKLALVDCGFGTCEQALVAALGPTGHRLEDLDMILYTHPHVDHFGGHLTSDPTLRVSRAGAHWTIPPLGLAARLREMPHHLSQRLPTMAEMILSAGVIDFFSRLIEGVPNIHIDRVLADGDIVDLGNTRLEAVLTPGHCPDHVVFVDHARGHVFSGDLLMDCGPALVGTFGANVDQYLASLERLNDLPHSTQILPAHGKPLPPLGEALQQSVSRVQRLKDSLLSRMSDGWTELPSLFTDLKGAPDYVVSSIGQTLTFVDWLVESGLVEERLRSGIVEYRTAPDRRS